MHIVAASSDTTPRLESVLTLRASRDDIRGLLPGMELADELASPGPTQVVTVELSSGHRATVAFHERKQFVEILAPLEAGVELGLADLLVELSIPFEAVTWTHGRIDQRVLFERAEAATPTPLGGDIDVVSRYLRESSRETRYEIVDAYASYLNAKQTKLLYERLIRLMKRHRALNDIRNFEQIVAEDSIRAFSYWVDEMTVEYEREVRRYDRLSHGLSWVVITCGAVASLCAFLPMSFMVLPFAAAATVVSATQLALHPARRSRRTQEFVDRFVVLRNELDTLSTVREITPLNALQWQRLEKAIALIEA